MIIIITTTTTTTSHTITHAFLTSATIPTVSPTPIIIIIITITDIIDRLSTNIATTNVLTICIGLATLTNLVTAHCKTPRSHSLAASSANAF
jgi:hypothetical protein